MKCFNTEAKAQAWYADRVQRIADGRSRKIEKVEAPKYAEVMRL